MSYIKKFVDVQQSRMESARVAMRVVAQSYAIA